MPITRAQHYVWRRYLEAWGDKSGRVPTRRGGRVFRANPINIGQQRDFYKVPYLTPEDELLIRKFVIEPMKRPQLRESAEGWLDFIAGPSRLRRLLESRSVPVEGELKEAFRQVETEIEEKFHSKLESDFVSFLSLMIGGDAKFWEDGTEMIPFCLFIGQQVMRTKRVRDRFIGSLPLEAQPMFERCWPVMRLSMGSNLGGSLYVDRARWRLRILRAEGDVQLITGDNPVNNLLQPVNHDGMALYYPVSPTKGMLIELKDRDSPVGAEDQLSDKMVHSLNNIVAERSLESIFGIDGEYLISLPVPTDDFSRLPQ